MWIDCNTGFCKAENKFNREIRVVPTTALPFSAEVTST